MWIGDMLRRKQSDMSSSLAGDRRQRGLQRHRRVVDIDQHAHAVALIEAPGDLRDVGRRIAVAEKGLELRLAALGEHLAVAVLVEAVDHHAVVAGEVLEHRAVSSHSPRSDERAEQAIERLLDMPGQVHRRPGALELDHQATRRQTMHESVEGDVRLAQRAAYAQRNRIEFGGQMRREARGEVARQFVEPPADGRRLQAEESRRVGARLDDGQVRFTDDQQRAMRLDRACEMDLLALAIGKIGLAECRGRRRVPGHSGRGYSVSGTDARPSPSMSYRSSFAYRLWRLKPRSSAAAVRLPPVSSRAASM